MKCKQYNFVTLVVTLCNGSVITLFWLKCDPSCLGGSKSSLFWCKCELRFVGSVSSLFWWKCDHPVVVDIIKTEVSSEGELNLIL